MSEDRHEPEHPRPLPLAYLFAFTLAVALVIALQAAIAIAASRETYERFITNMTPQVAILFALDAISKGLAICGIFAFCMHRSAGAVSRQSEYLWPLLGLVVAMRLLAGFWSMAPVGITHILGGGLAMYFSRSIAWKCLYLLIALNPFLMMASFTILANTMPSRLSYFSQVIPCMYELAICCCLGICTFGTQPNFLAWGGILSQVTRTWVTIIFVLLLYLGMMK